MNNVTSASIQNTHVLTVTVVFWHSPCQAIKQSTSTTNDYLI